MYFYRDTVFDHLPAVPNFKIPNSLPKSPRYSHLWILNVFQYVTHRLFLF